MSERLRVKDEDKNEVGDPSQARDDIARDDFANDLSLKDYCVVLKNLNAKSAL